MSVWRAKNLLFVAFTYYRMRKVISEFISETLGSYVHLSLIFGLMCSCYKFFVFCMCWLFNCGTMLLSVVFAICVGIFAYFVCELYPVCFNLLQSTSILDATWKSIKMLIVSTNSYSKMRLYREPFYIIS